MKCRKCGYRNVSQADYCFKCGNKFKEEEKKFALEHSFISKISKLKEKYDRLTFSKITGSIPFKIGLILFTLVIGIYGVYSKGVTVRLEDGDSYTYEYNRIKDEYYLYVDDVESNVNLYLPHEVSTFYVKQYDKEDNVLQEYSVHSIDEVIVKINDVGEYYKISIDSQMSKTGTVKIFVARNAGDKNA